MSHYNDGKFPRGATCGSHMSMPFYDSKEEMKKYMLTAFRLCGEIDNDGGGYYNQEQESDGQDIYGDEYQDENRGSDSDNPQPELNLRSRAYPVRVG